MLQSERALKLNEELKDEKFQLPHVCKCQHETEFEAKESDAYFLQGMRAPNLDPKVVNVIINNVEHYHIVDALE